MPAQVVYGVLRYNKFLNAFLASFWDKNRYARGQVMHEQQQHLN
jgi:hypothetical protein